MAGRAIQYGPMKGRAPATAARTETYTALKCWKLCHSIYRNWVPLLPAHCWGGWNWVPLFPAHCWGGWNWVPLLPSHCWGGWNWVPLFPAHCWGGWNWVPLFPAHCWGGQNWVPLFPAHYWGGWNWVPDGDQTSQYSPNNMGVSACKGSHVLKSATHQFIPTHTDVPAGNMETGRLKAVCTSHVYSP